VAEVARATGATVECLAADLANEQEVVDVFDQAVSVSGGLDILVNNAGIYDGKPIESSNACKDSLGPVHAAG
jgi:3-oxoacyl-[acyl-carrier protein] reductase